VRAVGTLVALGLTACAREPAERLCPDLAEGGLVVTEIHGTPSPDDGSPEWVELFAPAATDLEGIKIRFRRLDGSTEVDILVRHSVPVAAGDFVVLGLEDDGALEPYLDYGFAADFQQEWLTAAAVDVESCTVLIDRAQYSSLPSVGTFSLGTNPPDALANDDPDAWCDDPNALGTAGQPNITCPP